MSESDSFDWLPALLVLQGVLAALDVYLARRAQPAREALNAALFLLFAWLAWLGAYALVFAAVLLALVLVGVSSTPAAGLRRVLHNALLLNLGALAALFVPVLRDWGANPTELAPAHHGWMSWALTAWALVAAFLVSRALIARSR